MSVESMALVLHHSRAKGTAKLVLVGIANHDGDGGAWPTVATLARYANVTERAVQDALAKLVKLGEVIVYRQAGGTQDLQAWERPNRYDVTVGCPPWCDRSKHHRPARGWHQLEDGTYARPDQMLTDLPDRVKQTSPGEADFTGGGEADFTRGGEVGFTQTVHITQPRGQDSASTTDRARETDRQPAAKPPADELAAARARLREATEEHKRRSHR